MIDEHAFGNFQLEQRGRNASPLKLSEDTIREVVAPEIRKRAVDRDAAKGNALLAKLHNIGEHAVDHPVRQVAREQAVVECGLDAVGRLKTAPRMMPAPQGCDTDNVATATGDLCPLEGEDPTQSGRAERW